MDSERLAKVKEVKKWLHAHPEVSNQEVKTQAYLKDFITKYLPQYEIHDHVTWFYCMKPYQKGKKTIVLRADHDAIVNSKGEVFHGCGHDGHTAILLAVMLEDIPSENNVIYLFQPAEENGTGAKMCQPLFEKYPVDEVFGLHNMPGLKEQVIFYHPETIMCASVGNRINLKGKQSHASEPEKGLNPAYAIAQFVQEIEPLAQYRGFKPFSFLNHPFSSLVMATIIQIEIGSSNFGISPANGSISLTLRSAKQEELTVLEEFIQSYFRNLEGFDIQIEELDRFHATVAHPRLLEEALKRIHQHHLKVELLEIPIRASEDFGYYGQWAPSVFFLIGTGDCPALHQDDFYFKEDIIPVGVALFKALIQ